MALEWMGRYRELIQTLTQYINLSAREMTVKKNIDENITLTSQEWQVLEYIIEHEEDDVSMKQVSDRLALPQSSFSKHTKYLWECDLVDKYQVEGNRKNIILKPSDKGRRLYDIYSEKLASQAFQQFFQILDHCSDEDIQLFTEAIQSLTKAKEEMPKLVKLVKKK